MFATCPDVFARTQIRRETGARTNLFRGQNPSCAATRLRLAPHAPRISARLWEIKLPFARRPPTAADFDKTGADQYTSPHLFTTCSRACARSRIHSETTSRVNRSRVQNPSRANLLRLRAELCGLRFRVIFEAGKSIDSTQRAPKRQHICTCSRAAREEIPESPLPRVKSIPRHPSVGALRMLSAPGR